MMLNFELRTQNSELIACQLGTLADGERLRQEANELVSIFTAGMRRLRPVVPRTKTEK
jgi:hypothetical protein